MSRNRQVHPRRFLVCVGLAFALPIPLAWSQAVSDKALFDSACAACHGTDGTGRSHEELGFATPPPDFSDCEFATREPDADWYAIIHEGGPVRAFDRMMPAFGDALTEEESYAILRHVRSFCTDGSWPRGEFNLPRPLFTEKAFPEDEAVATLTFDTGDSNEWELELLYEKRIGPRGMVEVALPFVGADPPSENGSGGLGDIAIAYKYSFFHDLDSGNIVSAGVEAILPTGDEDAGLGKGTAVIEPFVAWGKLLPSDMFFQAHLFGEFPTDSGFEDELGLRMAFGRTWTMGGPFGRAVSPMIEVLAARELASGADTNVDLVPQVQVSLNTRQHILLSVGARIPASNTQGRDAVIGMYLLWDWFDGGFLDGW